MSRYQGGRGTKGGMSSTIPLYVWSRTRETEVVSSVTREGNTVNLPEPPSAQVGIPIPYVNGRQLITQPNLLWIGNLRPITETVTEVEEVCETKILPGPFAGTIKEVTECEQSITNTINTIGYYVSMQLGICLGPDVSLRKMYFKGKEVTLDFDGLTAPDPGVQASGDIRDDDGVFTGRFHFYGGNYDQTADPFLTDFHPAGQLPGYPGVAYIVLEDIRFERLDGAIWFEVERMPNVLGLSPLRNEMRQPGDPKSGNINPASALADFLTNDWGGAGLGTDVIDTDSFEDTAEQLWEEDNGCAMFIAGDVSITSILDIISDQAYGYIYEDPSLKKIAFKLIRFENLSVSGAFKFNDGNITNVNNWNRSAWLLSANKIRITFNNRNENYKDDSILGYNFSAINDTLTKDRVAEISYPFVYEPDTARELLKRDLVFYGTPSATLTLETNREASSLVPGDAVQAYAPTQGVPPLFGIVQEVKKFKLDDNKVIVSILEVQRLDNQLDFGTPETSIAEDVSLLVEEPKSGRAISAPYWYARQRGTSLVEAQNSDYIIPMFLVVPENNVQASFRVDQMNNPQQSGTPLTVVRNASYATTGKLNASISQWDGLTDGALTSIEIKDVLNPTWLETSPGSDGAARGDVLVFINDEIFTFETVSGPTGGVYTLTGVTRSMIDTVPEAHAEDDDVFVFSGKDTSVLASGVYDYPLPNTPNWRVTSNTAIQQGDNTFDGHYIEFSGWSPDDNRLTAPLRPHLADIDGARQGPTDPVFLTVGNSYTINWKTRARGNLTLAFPTDNAQDSELNDNNKYQTHRVNVIDSDDNVLDCGETADDGNYNSLSATINASAVHGAGFLFVESELENAKSVYRDLLPVVIFTAPAYVQEDDATVYYAREGTDTIYQKES